MSPTVQASPSVHGLALSVLAQPVAGAHESSVHGLPSLQSRTFWPARQIPPPQVSPTVQTFASSHGLAFATFTQPVAGAHDSSVHELSSSQSNAPGPVWPAPSPQVSPTVQASPSLHGLVLSVWAQPVAGTHESSVHGLP